MVTEEINKGIEEKNDNQKNVLSDITVGQGENVAKTFVSTLPNYNKLIELASDKPWITLKTINTNTLQISASTLRRLDNVVDGNNKTFPHITAIGKEIYEMIKKGVDLSVNIETFVGKEYILNRLENFPDSDIGDGIEGACEARSGWAKLWITQPDDLPELVHAPIHTTTWTSVSDKQSMIYTITFGSKNTPTI